MSGFWFPRCLYGVEKQDKVREKERRGWQRQMTFSEPVLELRHRITSEILSTFFPNLHPQCCPPHAASFAFSAASFPFFPVPISFPSAAHLAEFNNIMFPHRTSAVNKQHLLFIKAAGADWRRARRWMSEAQEPLGSCLHFIFHKEPRSLSSLLCLHVSRK